MQVIALADGFYGGMRRRKNAVFDVPEGTKAKWFMPVESEAAKAPDKAGKEPKAPKQKEVPLSTMGKDASKSFVDTMKQELA